MPFKVLVVDDDAGVRTVLKKYLSSRGFTVVYTDNGSEGLLLAREAKPDIVLLDSDLPGGLDGHSVCRALRGNAATRDLPIVVMSGVRVSEKDLLEGFEGGADDYVTKPFTLPVLLARIEAVLRRYGASSGSRELLREAGIVLDPLGRTVKVKGRNVPLTRKEFDLLAVLIGKPGRVHKASYLLETVWGYDPADYSDPATVEVHVSRLRKKLGAALGRRIVNVIGHGYKFEG